MTKKATIKTVTSGYASNTQLNFNFEALNDKLDNTLSLDGSSPNAMSSDLDVNNNDILNVGTIESERLTVGGVTVTDATYVPDWKGPWVTSTSYVVNDIINEAGSSYICLVAHTSGTFSTDLTALKWELFAAKGSSGAGTGDMLGANNLSDVSNAATSRSNIGAISGLSEDMSPQLTAPLDTNDNTIYTSRGADVASATELLLLLDGNSPLVTGTATITTVEDTADVIPIGTIYNIRFAAACTLENSADLALITDADITTEAGDTCVLQKHASGDWLMLSYQRKSGRALVTGYSKTKVYERGMSGEGTSSDFTDLGAYDEVRIEFLSQTSSSSTTMYLRTSTDNGASFDTTNYVSFAHNDFSGFSNTTSFILNDGVSGTNTGQITLDNFNNSNARTFILGLMSVGKDKVCGYRDVKEVNNAFQLVLNSGTFTGGKVVVWGITY